MICFIYCTHAFLTDRNKNEGHEWEFQIDCQKKTKGAKHKFHNWKSANFSTMGGNVVSMDAASSDEEEMVQSYPIQESRRSKSKYGQFHINLTWK